MSTLYNPDHWVTIATTSLDQKGRYARIWIEVASPVEHSTRVRYTVSIDSTYPGQSTIMAELWTATSGWQEIMHFLGTDPRIESLIKGTGYTDNIHKAEVIATLRDDFLRPLVAAFKG